MNQQTDGAGPNVKAFGAAILGFELRKADGTSTPHVPSEKAIANHVLTRTIGLATVVWLGLRAVHFVERTNCAIGTRSV